MYLDRLMNGVPLLPDTRDNLEEVVGILKSYGVVLDAYSKNLIYIADNQFLVLFPFFKYFDGEVNSAKIVKHLWHDRINFEYAEYCMRAMMWHGGGGLDLYLDSPEFLTLARLAIDAKTKSNLLVRGLDRLSSDLFIDLSDRFDEGKIQTIPEVVEHVKVALVAAASLPITYGVKVKGQHYDILPASAGLTFLGDVALPYVEAVFFRGTPFPGTVSYNAQAHQIPYDPAEFTYGALFADPVPIGGAGIPPTQLMQDMRHYLPDYLLERYRNAPRGEMDLRVKICQSFQKSMFCVTSATLFGIAPHPVGTEVAAEQQANRAHFTYWLDRLATSRLEQVNL
jgi:CO2 hydration protein (ChpXY)